MRSRRPACAHNTDALESGPVVLLPCLQQIVEHRIQVLLGRIPGLQEVMVQPDLIDRPNRRLGVRVGGQEHARRIGEILNGGRQELDAVHLRHAMVNQEQGDRLVAQADLRKQFQRRWAGGSGEDAITVAVVAPQIALNRSQNIRIVIDCKNSGLRHRPGLLDAATGGKASEKAGATGRAGVAAAMSEP